MTETEMGFTDTQIASWKAGRPPHKDIKIHDGRYEVVEDGTGLAVRVSVRGVKSFQYLFRHEGKPRRMTLGIYRPAGMGDMAGASRDERGIPHLTLADARIKLAEAKKQRDAGVNPAEEAVAEHRAERKAETISDLCDLYLEQWAEKNKRPQSIKRDRWQIEKDIRPRWGSRKASNITREDVIALLDDIVARGAPVMANRTKALLSKMFRFGVRRGVIKSTPVIEIDRPGGKEEERQRILSDIELRLVWRATLRLEQPYKEFVQLLILTGQRRTEVASMQEPEINQDERLWTIPAAKMKGKVAHAVPLPDMALDVIRFVPRGSRGDYVLASRTKRGKHVAAYDDVKKWLDDAIRQIQIEDAGPGADPSNIARPEPWTLHDLRRTFRTGLSRLGVSDEIGERLIAHIENKLKRTYNAYQFLPERRDAMQRWADHIHKLVSDNVIRLRA